MKFCIKTFFYDQMIESVDSFLTENPIMFKIRFHPDASST